jgi:two-component sensor histidine kinase
VTHGAAEQPDADPDDAPAPADTRPAPSPSGLTIRLRLGRILALALLPVLVLGVLQAMAGFRRDAEQRRDRLIQGGEQAAAVARAKLESAGVLLEALAPDSVGLSCAPRLRAVRDRLEGYENLIRFDAIGRVSCAADTVPADPERRNVPWFAALQAGDRRVVTSQPAGALDESAALLAAIPAYDADGRFEGALVAVIRLASLRPDVAGKGVPRGTAVALTDQAGNVLTSTEPAVFSDTPRGWTDRSLRQGATLYQGRSRGGERRVYAGAPLVDDDVFVLLSAPEPNVLSWAWLNPGASIVLPLLAWLAAFLAVWLAGERMIVRWLAYLDRIASLYAKGRFSVRPVKALDAPPEIATLARTLDDMAAAIEARDHTLRENLAQKDALMREIHHRVKNNLQIITSLLNMQQRALHDDAAKAALSDTRQRITALALIYRALYQSVDLRRVEVRPFLEELLAQLLNGEGPRAQPVRTDITSAEMTLDPDKLAPFALFAVEAVTNALKHAFPGRQGHIAVNFSKTDSEARLEIVDDGVGAPQDSAAGGVGRTLMTAFARQLRGRAEIESKPGGGTAARLIFPIPNPGSHNETGRGPAASTANPALPPQGNQAAA